MHNFLSIYNAVLAASSSSTKKTSSTSSYGTLIFLLLLGVLAYMFFLRPRSQQARRKRETLLQVSVGDEVLTGAGIFGRVLDVESDRITIETAPGTRITVLRSTIARRLTEHPEEEAAWSGDGADEDEAPEGHAPEGQAPRDELRPGNDEEGGAAAVGEAGGR
ncbi:MAG: preprotein translocase subunit YajC [Acidimicrobiales bacterium]|jgi:preprotein translocase subunit YajC